MREVKIDIFLRYSSNNVTVSGIFIERTRTSFQVVPLSSSLKSQHNDEVGKIYAFRLTSTVFHIESFSIEEGILI